MSMRAAEVLGKSTPMTVLPLPSRTRPAVTVRRRVHARPRVDLARLTRYRGGTYSHTVDTIVFTDGTSARTDLIRLNPNIDAYSLDFTAVAPTRPSQYSVDTWSAVPNLRARLHETEVDWILRNSFPTLRTPELSRRLRAAGYPLGSANIAEHEAIAGTQAAIWYLTNGLELDNRPLNVPFAVRRTAGAWAFEFDGEPELGGYSVRLTSPAAATLRLYKSVDGVTWQAVSGSTLQARGEGVFRKVLGVGATVSGSSHGKAHRGHRHYRLSIAAPDGGPVDVADVDFWLGGSGNHRNADRIVHLYNYLLAGARRARHQAVAPQLMSAGVVVDGDLVGPFRLRATSTVALSVGGGHVLVDADGAELAGLVEPDAEFYLRRAAGSGSATMTAAIPGTPSGFGGRVITGVARDEAARRLTPLALAVPAQLVVDFEIDWETARNSVAPVSRLASRRRQARQ
jgi:TQXA domain-containing protein